MISLSSVALIGFVLLLLLLFLKMPVGICMALAGFIGISLTRGITPALIKIGLLSYSTATSQHLSVIPLFLLMGTLAAYGGISRGAFSTLNKWVGHFPGGLAMAGTGACALFGAVSGSHIATAAAMCSAALPEMRRYHYDDKLSLGSIAAGGNLGFLIPPSGAFIIYGYVTQQPVGPLFIAGILPGILLTILFCLTIYIECRLNPLAGAAGSRFGWLDRLKALKSISGIAFIFVLVIGGIYAGIFTPTEAGAIGVFATFCLGILNRKLTRSNFNNALMETVKTTAMIFLIIIGASIFSVFLTTTEITMTLAQFVENLDMNRFVILAVVLVFYILAGFFLDIFSLLLVSLPVFFPIITQLGFDPIHFAVLVVLTIIMGSITPPIGIVVFALHGMVKEVPLFTIFRGCIPFLVAMVAGLIILIVFPEISLVLPGYMHP